MPVIAATATAAVGPFAEATDRRGVRLGVLSGPEKGVARTKHGMPEPLPVNMFRVETTGGGEADTTGMQWLKGLVVRAQLQQLWSFKSARDAI